MWWNALASSLSSFPFILQGLRLHCYVSKGTSNSLSKAWFSLASMLFLCCSNFGAVHYGTGVAYPPSLTFEGEEMCKKNQLSDRFKTNSGGLSPGPCLLITKLYLKCQTYFLEMLGITEERKSHQQSCHQINFSNVSFKIRRQSLYFSVAFLELDVEKNQFFVFVLISNPLHSYITPL